MMRFLPMRLREQRLADGVVDLVRAGVVEVFALEKDLRAADFLRQALGVIDRRRPADVMLQIAIEFGDELRIAAQTQIRVGQFLERRHQRFGDVDAAVRAEVALRVGPCVEVDALVLRWSLV